MSDVPTSTYIRQHQNLLEVPKDILDVFDEADQRCGFKQVLDQLTYPPKGPISIPGDPEGENFRLHNRQASRGSDCNVNLTSPAGVNQSIYGACNGGCATYTTALEYLTLKRPWYDHILLR